MKKKVKSYNDKNKFPQVLLIDRSLRAEAVLYGDILA